MSKDPTEMTIEELDVHYGKPKLLATVTHILSFADNIHHDRFSIEVFTEESQRLNLRFTEAALRSLISLAGNRLTEKERPKAN